MKKAIELIGVVLGSAIFSLIVTLVISGIGSSGVIGVELTRAYFWIAFVMAICAAPIAAGVIWRSVKYAVICFCATALVMGSGLWRLDTWLTIKKAEQDAANQSPPVLTFHPPGPKVPIIKSPSPPKLVMRNPPQDNSVHLNGSKIEQESSGDCSPNIVGGSTTVNCAPKPQAMFTGGPNSQLEHNLFIGNVAVGIPIFHTDGSAEGNTFAGNYSLNPSASPENMKRAHDVILEYFLKLQKWGSNNTTDEGMFVEMHNIEVNLTNAASDTKKLDDAIEYLRKHPPSFALEAK
jgi:hypothetical protein